VSIITQKAGFNSGSRDRYGWGFIASDARPFWLLLLLTLSACQVSRRSLDGKWGWVRWV